MYPVVQENLDQVHQVLNGTQQNKVVSCMQSYALDLEASAPPRMSPNKAALFHVCSLVKRT